MHQPKLAIIDSNILSGLGLQSILEEIIPVAEVILIDRFEDIHKLNIGEYAHFFVASRIFFEHNHFFRTNNMRCIVLVNGEMSIAGVKTINVCQSEKGLVRDIISLNRMNHGPEGPVPLPYPVSKGHNQKPTAMLLSQREAEVAILLSKGLINKEIADRLNISLTTVISHRKNIMDKLHARSLADIIIYVVMNNLADISEL